MLGRKTLRAPVIPHLAFGLLLACAYTASARADDVTLAETGSTLMLPLLQAWAQGYARTNPALHVRTAGSGSGAGIMAAIDGTAELGASDAYMSDLDVQHHPGILNIPLAISAQTVNYNLPGLVAPLRLSGPVLAGIYGGAIRSWNAPQIAAINPGVALPAHPIVPIRRSDASGDTFIFTQFLSFATPDWESGPGYGTGISWPAAVASAPSAAGNEGVVQLLARTPYGLAYVGGSFAGAIADARLGAALLQNASGRYVQPTPQTIAAAAAALTPRTPPDERLTLAFAPGEDAYPLINYEYAIVRAVQADAARAAALRDFLLWAVTPGQGNDAAYLDPVHFIPLPPAIRALSEIQIASIRTAK